MRSPELRHEVPVPIPDPFLYLEHDGERYVMVSSLEAPRIAPVVPDVTIIPPEELGLDELITSGMPYDEVWLQLALAACRRVGVVAAIAPSGFPLELGDFLRANGIEVRAEREQFTARRRVKNAQELAGIRRAQKGAEEAMRAVRDLLRRAEPNGTHLHVDGEVLTCERMKALVETIFAEHNLTAE